MANDPQPRPPTASIALALLLVAVVVACIATAWLAMSRSRPSAISASAVPTPSQAASRSPEGSETSAAPSPDAPPPAQTDSEFRLVVNEADGYQVLLPRGWLGRETEPDSGTRSFGWALDRFHPALSISVGTADGTFHVCARTCTETATAQSLADLDAALESVPDGEPTLSHNEYHDARLLGGHAARVEGVTFPGGYLLGPVAFYRVYALHDGRPVVLTFDHWSTAPRGTPPGWVVSRIIDSFRFLDGTSSARWQTYHSDQHGYEVEVPAGWIAEETPLSSVTYFYSDEHVALIVSVGDASGRITICPGGSCRRVVVERLDQLDQLLPPYDTRQVSPIGNEVRDAARLDGREALVTRPEPPIGMVSWLPGWAYAFAVTPGRPPIVLRFSSGGMRQATEGVLTDLQARIVDSFGLD